MVLYYLRNERRKVVSKTIEEVRAGLGLNQIDFAKRLGVSPRTYTHRVTGKRQWSIDEIVRAQNINGGNPVVVDIDGKQYEVTVKLVG